LDDVVVKAYFVDQPLLQSPASVGIINSQTLQKQAPGSLLGAMNTIPGVRMEERSPGSYRLSIRGSLLRSPFGVRNVKIYLNDFMLTDAGGNSYLNLLDASAVGRIEILKGPEGSIFGANSGGVVLIKSQQLARDSTQYSAGISGGSFGMVHQHTSFQIKKQDLQLAFNQSFQKTEGYRDHSAMERQSYLLSPSWNYSKSGQIDALVIYSNLNYKTPGGLTKQQADLNPRAARQIALDQKAAIFNKTLLTGISHHLALTDRLKHVISITGSTTDFKNPFITNYEERSEKSLGLRTYIENKSALPQKWNWQFGVESQRTSTDINNFNNKAGVRGAMQASDQLVATQSFLFGRAHLKASDRFNVESALSLNFYDYQFKSFFPSVIGKESKSFSAQLLPRLAFSYLLKNNLAVRASLSKGYSAPTIAEVRPANKVINTNIDPERGWNYETGLRLNAFSGRLYLDLTAFYFRLNNAIVRRVDMADSEFFINAGGTKQKGIELQISTILLPAKTSGLIRGAQFIESYTTNNFRFNNYIVSNSNFSNNKLTGVPDHSLLSTLDLKFPQKINLQLQHNLVTSIPLNDANTVQASQYQLVQAYASYVFNFKKNKFTAFAGGDNLLNSKYSLGNDLNAFGSRYYNPAAVRNFYFGLKSSFN
jgi:iron complex outermembrane receptor protein